METFLKFIELAIRFLRMDISIYGYTFSYWDVIIFTLVLGIIFWFIGGVINGD